MSFFIFFVKGLFYNNLVGRVVWFVNPRLYTNVLRLRCVLIISILQSTSAFFPVVVDCTSSKLFSFLIEASLLCIVHLQSLRARLGRGTSVGAHNNKLSWYFEQFRLPSRNTKLDCNGTKLKKKHVLLCLFFCNYRQWSAAHVICKRLLTDTVNSAMRLVQGGLPVTSLRRMRELIKGYDT